jgi:hypothetical protein
MTLEIVELGIVAIGIALLLATAYAPARNSR